jgi:hypothetical protein
MGVAQLVRRKAWPDSGAGGESAELRADRGGRPRSPARRTVDDAEQRPDRQLCPCAEPRPQLLPAPLVHADLASAPSLAVADHQQSGPVVEIVLGESERLLDAQAARHKTTIIARTRRP